MSCKLLFGCLGAAILHHQMILFFGFSSGKQGLLAAKVAATEKISKSRAISSDEFRQLEFWLKS